MEDQKVHGQKGVYCGGEWINIEDCHKLVSKEKHNCENCPSKSNNTNDFDVVIIGAGCVGSSIARELSKYKLKVFHESYSFHIGPFLILR
jgi:glycerol-3-phosphate dehydrogenase